MIVLIKLMHGPTLPLYSKENKEREIVMERVNTENGSGLPGHVLNTL